MATLLPCRRAVLLLLLLGCYPQISPGSEGDQPAFTLHSNTNEVRLTFSASDNNDHGVATLQPSDFVVVDRGIVVRDFESFTRPDWTNPQIAIIVDNSQSVAPHFHGVVHNLVEIVTQTAGIPDENLAIFSFRDSQPLLVCTANCRASNAASELADLRTSGFTPLFDTVVVAAEFLAKHSQPQTRKILLVISDGSDTISGNSLASATEAAVRSDAEVYTIDVNGQSGAAVLNRLAAATGGRYFSSKAEARDITNAILDGFQARYVITYKLPSLVFGFHDVRVLPTHNMALQFRSRCGYYFSNNVR